MTSDAGRETRNSLMSDSRAPKPIAESPRRASSDLTSRASVPWRSCLSSCITPTYRASAEVLSVSMFSL